MLNEVVGISHTEVFDPPSAFCNERVHETPPVIRIDERHPVPVFESIELFIDERREEKLSVTADMHPQ